MSTCFSQQKSEDLQDGDMGKDIPNRDQKTQPKLG